MRVKRPRPVIVVCLAMMAWFAVTAGGAAAGSPSLRLSPSALGPMRFGMDARQASTALGGRVDVEPSVGGCSLWTMPGLRDGTEVFARDGRLSYVEIYLRGPRTTRGITVGDGLARLRHRYRGRLHGGRTAFLGYAEYSLFVSEAGGDATYELEFDILHGRVAHISAGTRRTIETFGECA